MLAIDRFALAQLALWSYRQVAFSHSRIHWSTYLFFAHGRGRAAEKTAAIRPTKGRPMRLDET
jgi:hypothetical protein